MDRSFFVKEAKKIVELGREKGLPIRVMGACAIVIHSSEHGLALHDELGRTLSDLDFMTTGSMDKVKKLLSEIGYKPRSERLLTISQEARYVCDHEETGLMVDVFFDELSMCHTIDFRHRIKVDHLTISLADILLEKLQIVQIAEKDIKDIIILLREHDVGENDEDTIDCGYVSKLLSKDWGFYYTATTNLRKTRDHFLDNYFGVLSEEDRAIIEARINYLLDRIEKEDKSFGWKMRSRIGTKMRWYREVEEIAR